MIGLFLILFPPIVAVVASLVSLLLVVRSLEDREERRKQDGHRETTRYAFLRKRWKGGLILLTILLVIFAFEVPDIPIWTTHSGTDRLLLGPNYGRWGGAAGFGYDVKRYPILQNTLIVKVKFDSNIVLIWLGVSSSDPVLANTDVTLLNFAQIYGNATYHLPIEQSRRYTVQVSYVPNNSLTGISNSTVVEVSVDAVYSLSWGDVLH